MAQETYIITSVADPGCFIPDPGSGSGPKPSDLDPIESGSIGIITVIICIIMVITML
jgi:hypothetical protein